MNAIQRRLRKLEDAQRIRLAAYDGSGTEAFIAEIERLAARLRAEPDWPGESQLSDAEMEREIGEIFADYGPLVERSRTSGSERLSDGCAIIGRLCRLETARAPFAREEASPPEQAIVDAIMAARRARLGSDYEPEPVGALDRRAGETQRTRAHNSSR